jgi:hypothetical protein
MIMYLEYEKMSTLDLPKRKNYKTQFVLLSSYEFDGMNLQEALAKLEKIVEEHSLIDWVFKSSYGELFIVGYVELTESEIAKLKKRQEAAKKAAEAKKKKMVEKEMALLKKLSKKYPNISEE